jgi:hypothetical protein
MYSMCTCSYKVFSVFLWAYWKKYQFSQSKVVKDLWVITASSIGKEKKITEF